MYAAWGGLRELLMAEAHGAGTPIARAMALEFPNEAVAWSIQDQWMLGEDLIVAPVMDAKARSRHVWLPPSDLREWRHIWSGQLYHGNQSIVVNSSIGQPPVFTRASTLVELFLAELKKNGLLPWNDTINTTPAHFND